MIPRIYFRVKRYLLLLVRRLCFQTCLGHLSLRFLSMTSSLQLMSLVHPRFLHTSAKPSMNLNDVAVFIYIHIFVRIHHIICWFRWWQLKMFHFITLQKFPFLLLLWGEQCYSTTPLQTWNIAAFTVAMETPWHLNLDVSETLGKVRPRLVKKAHLKSDSLHYTTHLD